jgi:replicative DNA helicase
MSLLLLAQESCRLAQYPPSERNVIWILGTAAYQAVTGNACAILVNNDAFDRISDFLRPEHFSEEVHRRIFDVASQLIRAGKLASPITLKTFLGEHDLGGVTVPQYLARLAAEATTVINAEDYGRTIHDLALRRDLILIGEDIVNAAYDAPVNTSPREQIEDAERKLYSIAETGRYEGGFQRFSDALPPPSIWRQKRSSATDACLGSRQVSPISIATWAACSRPIL